MPIVTRSAPLKLDVLVVGGGVGGLSVAYMLSQAGHHVRVLERYDFKVRGGCRRLPPNVSKILRQWVGEAELMKVASRCVGSPFYNLRTGDSIGYSPWRPAVMQETGGDFLFMRHDDLVRMLYRLATDAGAKVDLNTAVVSVSSGSAPSVTLANGEVITADLLIGADGSSSIVRDSVVSDEDEVYITSNRLTVYTGVIPKKRLLNDPELGMLLEATEWGMWLGEHKAFAGHWAPDREEFSFEIFQFHEPSEGGVGSWREHRPIHEALLDDICPLVEKAIRQCDVKHQHFLEPIAAGPESWIDDHERIVLLGDAAHPTIPCGTHTASLAVEDAVVLGCLFSHIRIAEQIPTFLHAYEELRRHRSNFVVMADLAHLTMATLPAGQEAEARDRDALGGVTDDGVEEQMRKQFEELWDIFGYDAGDAAEEWWVSWGRLHETARDVSTTMDFTFSNVLVHYE